MNPFSRSLALGPATAGLLVGSSLPVAAQPGAPCAMLPDVLLAQALGPGARAHQGLSIPGNLETCAIADGSGQASISVFHISGGFDADSVPAAPSSSGVDVEVTPAGGVGDSAMYLLIKLDDGPLLSLRVQRGSDVYAFNTQDSPGARDRLMALAQATLGQ